MTEVTPEALQQSSEYAQDLVQQGMRPNQVDIDAMLAQMQRLQSTVDALQAERGVPLDPIDGHRKHLWDHLTLRDHARPDVDMTDVKALLSVLPENTDNITANMTEALHFGMEQLVKRHPGKELEYLSVLTAELHQMLLTRAGKSGNTHDRLAELESVIGSMKTQYETLQSDVQAKAAENAALQQKVSDLETRLARQETPVSHG